MKCFNGTGCEAGTEGDGMSCSVCENSFQPGGVAGVVACTDCPDGTFGADRSTSIDNCTGRLINTLKWNSNQSTKRSSSVEPKVNFGDVDESFPPSVIRAAP